MKNLAVILAFSSAVFTMVSCQKEEIAPVSPVSQPTVQALAASANETWILLEDSWNVTITAGSPATFVAKKPSGSPLSGSGIAANTLPQAVLDVMESLNVVIPSNAVCWTVSGGGFVLQIPTPGFATRVFWFDSANKIKTIGQVQP